MAANQNIQQLASQPEPWGSPRSYAQNFASEVNVNSAIAICLPKKEFNVDNVRILSQDVLKTGVSAQAYNEMSDSDVTLSTFEIAIRDVQMKMGASGDAIPNNKIRDLRNSPIDIFDFYVEAHQDALRGITEYELVNGDSSIVGQEFQLDGFLSSQTPRFIVPATNGSALDRMGSLDLAAASVKSGSGLNRPTIGFLHSTTRSKIARDIRVTGGTVTSRFLPPLGKYEMVVETASGPIFLVASDHFPIGGVSGTETSIIFPSLGTDLGVCLGVPAGTPGPHESVNRDILRPQGIVLVEYKRALLVSDSGKLVELSGFDLVGPD